MRSMFENLSAVYRSYKTAVILNILGLSIAFAAFLVIMMQVKYDYTFDRSYKDHQKIYRVDVINHESAKRAIISRGLADDLFKFPEIEQGALLKDWLGRPLLTVDANNIKSGFNEKALEIYPSFLEIFDFSFIEGTGGNFSLPDNIIIPESMARKFYGNEPALGRMISMLDNEYTIGGVYRDFPKNSSVVNAVYIPFPKDEYIGNVNTSGFYAFIKINSPGSVKAIESKFHPEIKDRRDGNFSQNNTGVILSAIDNLHFITDVEYDATPKANRQTVALIAALGFVIVIIASVNFANFSVALVPARMKSINTRKVFGAPDGRLRRGILGESLMINAIALILSFILVWIFSATSLRDIIDADTTLWEHPWLILLTAIIACLVGVISALYPAYYATSMQPAMVLRGSFGLSPGGKKIRSLLIGVQFTASFILIIYASFMYIQNRYMNKTSLGYDKEQLIISDISSNLQNKRDLLKNEFRSIPGVEGVSFAEEILSSSDNYMGWGRKYKDKIINFHSIPVDPDFIDLLGIEITEGRSFREEDKTFQSGKYIFNEKAKYIYDMELNTRIDESEIVGFIPNIKYKTLRTEDSPMAFHVRGVETDRLQYVYIKMKAGSDMNAGIRQVKDKLDKLDPQWSFDVRFFDDVFNTTYQKEQRLTTLITLFSIIAIAISVAGVFSLVVFESSYRRKEIGIRKVAGASVGEIFILFNRTYIIILAVCFVIACPIAYYVVNSWLGNFTTRTPVHPWVFILSGLLITLITLFTVSWQSLRAARKNPVESLKSQ